MKECVQFLHPNWQTDCFQRAGSTPYSSETCAVLEAMKTDCVFKMAITLEEQESVIRCRLLHQVCRMSSGSPDNKEFLERIQKAKGINT